MKYPLEFIFYCGKYYVKRIINYMSIVAKMTILTLSFLTSGQSFASQTNAGYVSQILVTTDSRAYFEQSGVRTARPTCATLTRWVIDTSTFAGQAMLSLVLSAQAQHMPVYISGSGNCALWGDSETANGVQSVN